MTLPNPNLHVAFLAATIENGEEISRTAHFVHNYFCIRREGVFQNCLPQAVVEDGLGKDQRDGAAKVLIENEARRGGRDLRL
jgi:hypothetical protein